MRYLTIILFLTVSCFFNVFGAKIAFKQNKGQWPSHVLYGSEFSTTKFYINNNGFNYCLYDRRDLVSGNSSYFNPEAINKINAHNYAVTFVNGTLKNVIQSDLQEEKYNYFFGRNRSRWASNVRAYGDLTFMEVYKNIDLKVYSEKVNLKYDFVIKPGGEVGSIKLKYCHTDGIELKNGELIIRTSVGDVIEKSPIAYQVIYGRKFFVKCNYIILDNATMGFFFPESYNKNYDIIIDPEVVVCSYSGSSIPSGNYSCDYDKNGNIYALGFSDVGYPTTFGAFQVSTNCRTSVMVSGFNSVGSSKIFATYIGGDSLNIPVGLDVNNNEITVFGITASDNYPISVNGYDTTYNGKLDYTISKLSMDGTTLLASTYVGGSNMEYVDNFVIGQNFIDYNRLGECQSDASGNVYVISTTQSVDFPITSGAISNVLSGGSDACVFKLDKSLSTLVWSTFLGGNSSEDGETLRLDSLGGVYCYGTTTSNNFPVTPGSISQIKAGISDLFVTHLNQLGNSIIASTYIGTSNNDYACMIELDQLENVYLTGVLNSTTTFTPSVGTYSNSNGYNTIYCINSGLSNVIFKTKFGSSIAGEWRNFQYSAFKVDSCNNIYIGGSGANCFPTTANNFMPYGGGTRDLYYMVFKPNCAALSFASYYGGVGNEGTGIGYSHFDNRGTLYQSVTTDGNIPTTSQAFAPTSSNTTTNTSIFHDAFIKIDFKSFINASSSYGPSVLGCPPFNAQFISSTNTGTSYWDLGDGNTSLQDTVSHIYPNLGTYNILLVITDTNTCNRTDTIKSILNIINPTVFDLGEDLPLCINDLTILQANVTASTYSWSTGQTTPTISVNQIGTYTLTINNGACNSSDDINVVIGEKKLSERFPNVITPNGDLVNDLIDFTKYNFDEVEFYVYDRWGRERFKITNPTEQWQPNDLNNGTYYYVVNYKSSCIGKYATDKGFISVFK